MITSADLILWSAELGKSSRDFVTKSIGDALSVVNGRLRSLEDRLAAVQTTPGPVGPQGPPGRDAEPIAGPKGDRGERGEKGDAGRDAAVDVEALAIKAASLIERPKDGERGKDGSSLTSGIGPPVFEAKHGDVYLDAASGDVYSWR